MTLTEITFNHIYCKSDLFTIIFFGTCQDIHPVSFDLNDLNDPSDVSGLTSWWADSLVELQVVQRDVTSITWASAALKNDL